jgi:putative flippase GtrA
MAKLKKSQRKELTRIGEYLVGGGLWFWSGYIIIVALNGRWTPFQDPNKNLFVINLIGNAVGITLNFLVERYWAFKTNRPTTLFIATQRYIIYTILNAFILNYFILAFLKNNFGIQPAIGQIIAAGFFTVWNYFWYKAWVFKGNQKHKRVRAHA